VVRFTKGSKKVVEEKNKEKKAIQKNEGRKVFVV